METPNETTDLEEKLNSWLAMLKSELRGWLRDAREATEPNKLGCRALSIAITHAETAYLWLNEVSPDENILGFD